VAPWLWLFEVHAVLRHKVSRGELMGAEAVDAWRLLRRQGIRPVHPRGLFERAWALAEALGRPTTYDTVYMAVAEIRGCDLWTADLRLANAVGSTFAWVRTPWSDGSQAC
jgi:predicted nucleic acid-binding protein